MFVELYIHFDPVQKDKRAQNNMNTLQHCQPVDRYFENQNNFESGAGYLSQLNFEINELDKIVQHNKFFF